MYYQDQYYLYSAEYYHYLNQSGIYTVDGLDDTQEYQAMKVVKIFYFFYFKHFELKKLFLSSMEWK